MSMTKRRKWTLAAYLVIAVVGILIIFPFKSIRSSAICANCLQHAYLHEKSWLGVTYASDCRLAQGHGGIMSSATFSPAIPQTDPKLYEEILGQPCQHCFKKGGFGRTSTSLIGTLHADGSYVEWHRFLPRVTVIEGIYHCYRATRSKDLATRTYGELDRLLPVDADEIWSYKELMDIGNRLKAVSSEEEWEKLLLELRSLKCE